MNDSQMQNLHEPPHKVVVPLLDKPVGDNEKQYATHFGIFAWLLLILAIILTIAFPFAYRTAPTDTRWALFVITLLLWGSYYMFWRYVRSVYVIDGKDRITYCDWFGRERTILHDDLDRVSRASTHKAHISVRAKTPGLRFTINTNAFRTPNLYFAELHRILKHEKAKYLESQVARCHSLFNVKLPACGLDEYVQALQEKRVIWQFMKPRKAVKA